MPQFLDLPVEILRQIVAQLADPDRGEICFFHTLLGPTAFDRPRLERDLAAMAALCRTSRALRGLTQPFLYSFVWLREPTKARLISLLQTWKARPELAGHVRRLTCKIGHVGWNDFQPPSHVEDTTFLDALPSELGVDLPTAWHQMRRVADWMAELMALQTVNIEHLEIRYSNMHEDFFDFLQPAPGQPVSHPPRFGNLKSMNIGSRGAGLGQGKGIQHLFDHSPGADSLALYVLDYPFEQRLMTAPNVTKLRITHPKLPPGVPVIIGILRSFPALADFATEWRGTRLDSVKIVKALAERADTLKSLAMPIGFQKPPYDISVPLESLTSLETLTINLSDVGAGPTSLMRNLPPSLRKLRLVEDWGHEDIFWIAKQTRDLRDCGFPELTVYLTDHWFEGPGRDRELDFMDVISKHREGVLKKKQEDVIQHVPLLFDGYHVPRKTKPRPQRPRNRDWVGKKEIGLDALFG